jgi:hypothetical protein
MVFIPHMRHVLEAMETVRKGEHRGAQAMGSAHRGPKRIARRLPNVLAYFANRINNAAAEDLNAAKTRPRVPKPRPFQIAV